MHPLMTFSFKRILFKVPPHQQLNSGKAQSIIHSSTSFIFALCTSKIVKPMVIATKFILQPCNASLLHVESLSLLHHVAIAPTHYNKHHCRLSWNYDALAPLAYSSQILWLSVVANSFHPHNSAHSIPPRSPLPPPSLFHQVRFMPLTQF